MVKDLLSRLTICNVTDKDIEDLDYMGLFENKEWFKHCKYELAEHLRERQLEYMVKMSSEFREAFEKNENTIKDYVDIKNCRYTFPIKGLDQSYMYYLHEEHDITSIQGLPYLSPKKCMNLIVDPYRFRKYSRKNPKDLRSESNDSFFENCLNDVDEKGKIIFICRKDDLEGFWSEKLSKCVESLIETDEYILIICSHQSSSVIVKCNEFQMEVKSPYILSYIPANYKDLIFLEESIYTENQRNEDVRNENDCKLIDDGKFISNVNDIKEKQPQSYQMKPINGLCTLNSGIIIDITDNKLSLSIYHDNSCIGGYDGGKYEAWIVPNASKKKELCTHAKSLLNNWKKISHYNVSSDIKKYWLKHMAMYITPTNSNIEKLTDDLLKGKKKVNYNKEEIKNIIKKFEDNIFRKEGYEAVKCFIVAFSNASGIFYRKNSYFSALFGRYFCPNRDKGAIRKNINVNKDKIVSSKLYKDIYNMIKSNFSK